MQQLQRISASANSANANGGSVLRPMNSTIDPCCGLHKRLVFPLRGGFEFLAQAAMLTLRAHAAQNTNSQVGLFRVVLRAMHEWPVLEIAAVRCAGDELEICGHCVLSQQVRKNQPLDELIDTKGGFQSFAAVTNQPGRNDQSRHSFGAFSGLSSAPPQVGLEPNGPVAAFCLDGWFVDESLGPT